MAQLNGLPVYEIKFNEDLEVQSGIDFVSLVDYPAIESNFIALAKQKVHFSTNKEKQLLYGAILIPDKPIYRNDPNGIGEYYVVFKEDTIEKLVRKFQATQKTININYQHLDNSQVASAVIQEIWLSGENDKSKDLGFDHPKGTAFIGAYIGNEKFWSDEIKTENVKGFSIEGFLDLEMSKLKQHKMNENKFVTAKTDTGVEIKTDAETMAVGVEVYTEENDVKTAVSSGTYMLDNGMTVVISVDESGKSVISAMEETMTEEEVQVIQSAMSKVISGLEAKIAELETKLSAIPAASSATETAKEEPAKTLMAASGKAKVYARLAEIRAKHKNLN